MKKKRIQDFISIRPVAMNKTEELVKNSIELPNIPLIVLTAGVNNSLTFYKPETRDKVKKIKSKLSNDLTKLIPGGKEIIVEGAGHTIHTDKPQAVINAIKEILLK